MVSLARKRISFETTFLREFGRTYAADVGFTPSAEAQMRRQRIYWPDILHVIRNGTVIRSDKDQAYGARWVVRGETCDDESLVLDLEVLVDRYCITLFRVVRA